MFTEEEQATGLGGTTVQDAWISLQLLDKAARSGVIQPTEFEVLGQWRQNTVAAIQRSIGKNYDEEVAKVAQAQAQAQQQAQQAELDAQEAQAKAAKSTAKKPVAKKPAAKKTAKK